MVIINASKVSLVSFAYNSYLHQLKDISVFTTAKIVLESRTNQ